MGNSSATPDGFSIEFVRNSLSIETEDFAVVRLRGGRSAEAEFRWHGLGAPHLVASARVA
jgi:hypothetical protein